MDTILEPVQDAIRELSINIDYVEAFGQNFTGQLGRPVVWRGERGIMRSLATFRQLTSVGIPHVFLFGWRFAENQISLVDPSPRSLKSLVILTKKLPYFLINGITERYLMGHTTLLSTRIRMPQSRRVSKSKALA